MPTGTIKILTVPGMNIIAPESCNGCNHLTLRRTCVIWAFPETKWNTTHSCPDYSRAFAPVDSGP